MKKINIQNDVDSRREIARMAEDAKRDKETKVQPITSITDDKTEESGRQAADKVRTLSKNKKNIRPGTSKGNV